MSDRPTAPICHTLALPCGSTHAFSVYTARIGAWWDARYTANPDTLMAVTIEPPAAVGPSPSTLQEA